VILNGPAARRGSVGDKVIIISYYQVPDEKAKDVKARILFVNDKNRPKEKKNGADIQSHRNQCRISS